MKKTVEEAAEDYADNYFIMQDTNYNGLRYGFIAGAKYQSEQMYSEEEVNYKVTKVILFERKDGMYQDGNGNQITTEFILQHKYHIHENDGIIYLES